MAENGNLNIYNNNNNNFNNLNSTTTESTREFINRSTTTTTTTIPRETTCINSTITTSLSGTLEATTTNINERTGGISESDATHYRLRGDVSEGFEYITCLSCEETFKSNSLSEVYDHYKERPHLRHYSNCLYCHGKVHRYYHNSLHLVKYYHNCLRWKRGEDQ